MGMVVSAAVSGVPIIEQLEQPYFKPSRPVIEPPLPPTETKVYIPPQPSVEAAKKTYSSVTTGTKKPTKNEKNVHLKGTTRPPSNPKKFAGTTRRKLQK